MASTATYSCKRCQQPFQARTADRARGWALFCSKSCKAIKQVQSGGASGPGHVGNSKPSKKYPRHDGRSPMKYKFCDTCGEPAINGAIGAGGIEWYCQRHEHEARTHPFSSEAHGQW